MKRVLGIDIGNTKTEYLAGDITGMVLASEKGRGANYQVIGTEETVLRLKEGVSVVLEKASLKLQDISFVYIGAAGADTEPDYINLNKIFKEVLGDVPFAFENDGYIALKNGVINKPGIVVTCGTGNINYSIDTENNILRLGGYTRDHGDVIGTETIARRVVSLAFRCDDRRELPSLLPKMLLKHLELETLADLYNLGWDQKFTPPIINAFLESCSLGDGRSLELAWEFSREVLTIVDYFHNRMVLVDDDYVISLDGHVFKRDNPFLRMIQIAVKERYNRDVIVRDTSPVCGAFYSAIEGMEYELNEEIINNIQNSYQKEAVK